MAKNSKNTNPSIEDNKPINVEEIIYGTSEMKGATLSSLSSEKKRPPKTIVDTGGINEDEIRERIANMDVVKYMNNHIPDTTNSPAKPVKITSSAKLRKFNLQEYKDILLSVPKISDRRTVFISNDIRESVVSIVRKLGVEKSSVSGFIENLLRHHLETYREDVEKWMKQ